LTVNADGQEVSAFVTKDGKYFVQVIAPLADTTPSQPSTTDTQQQQQPQQVVKSDVPNVELFIMSHCPYGTQEMKGIIPAVKALGDKINFTLRFVNYVMHGPDETKENVEMYCIQKEQQPKFLDYLQCYLNSTSGSASEVEACRKQVGIDENMLNSCITQADKDFDINATLTSSDTYPKFLIDDALNKKYGVQGSPTLVINGAQVSSNRDPASLGDAICQAFNNAPAICGSLSLSSATPSPGFGYSTTASNAGSAAQCG
jgi:protein-disulfide isomerase